MAHARNGNAVGKCRLCGETRPLCNSHLLPKALYRFLREPGTGQVHPVLLTNRFARYTAFQARSHLFCSECEQRFHKNGEDWVLRHCYRGKDKFLLRDYLRAIAPVAAWPRFAELSARTVPLSDLSKLVYYAGSIFWRSSIHEWYLDEERLELPKLGTRYENELANYLLGKGEFPDNAIMLIFVSDLDAPLLGCSFPYGGRQERFFHYRFSMPGLTFYLFLGSRVSDVEKRYCAVHSPLHPVYLGNLIEDEIVSDFVRTVRTSKADRKLEDVFTRRDALHDY